MSKEERKKLKRSRQELQQNEKEINEPQEIDQTTILAPSPQPKKIALSNTKHTTQNNNSNIILPNTTPKLNTSIEQKHQEMVDHNNAQLLGKPFHYSIDQLANDKLQNPNPNFLPNPPNTNNPNSTHQQLNQTEQRLMNRIDNSNNESNDQMQDNDV